MRLALHDNTKVTLRPFVILLERDGRRVDNVRENVIAQLPECEVWCATDSQNQEVDEFLNSGAVSIAPGYREGLTRTKAAVTMSHLRLWQKMVDEHIDRSLILEDDVRLSDDFQAKLTDVLSEVPEDYHMIYLYAHPRHFHPDRPENRLPGKEYVMRHSYTWCRLAYVLTAEGAERLIDYFQTLFDHGDLMINKAIEQGVIRAYMSRTILVHNQGQLTRVYGKEMLPSNVWGPSTRLSIMHRRLVGIVKAVLRR